VSALDDVVAATRTITVEDVLTSRAGWGFPSDFTLPAVTELFQRLPVLGARLSTDDWLRTLAGIPLLHQPGEAWLYNTCSDIQGALIERGDRPIARGGPRKRLFEPLGMGDTAFFVPPETLDRLPAYHQSRAMPLDDRHLDRAAGVRLGLRRARLDACRPAPVRADTARRRR
jgi:CubicO group peptidase (beta-lactamase class C family)